MTTTDIYSVTFPTLRTRALIVVSKGRRGPPVYWMIAESNDGQIATGPAPQTIRWALSDAIARQQPRRHRVAA